jgi:protein-tyrosine phosphatase
VVDLHCHLLPGIDDGPADMEAAVELARAASAEGVSTIAATPHLRKDHPGVVPRELADRCQEVRDELARQGIELEVVAAGEVDLLWALEASDEELRLCSYGQSGIALLVETPYNSLLPPFEELLSRLTLRGHSVVLAHPERNPTFQHNPERLEELVHRGALLQVTAHSLIRPARRSRSGALAQRLVRDGLAHSIASDAHGTATVERASLGAGAARARQLVGEARARWLVADAPAAIVAGRPLPPMPESEPPRRRLLSRLLSR